MLITVILYCHNIARTALHAIGAKNIVRFILLASLAPLTFLTAYPATIYVPKDFSTIQTAINYASNGDEILVSPGTYKENLNFKGKTLVLISAMGPYLTILDGNQSGSVVLINKYEPAGTLLEGFTITNGLSVDGAGVFCLNSAVAIRKNIIHNNTASMSGGGIHYYHCTSDITDNIIFQNNAGWSGGGINCPKSEAKIEGNIIYKNSAGKRGGGVRTGKGNYIIRNNIIFNNWARYGAGLTFGTGTTTNNMIFKNTAMFDGGGIYFTSHNAPAIFTNCTIVDNIANERGGGVCSGYGSIGFLSNSIIWNNSATSGDEIWIGSSFNSSEMTVDYCDVKGGKSGVYVAQNCTLHWGQNIIDSDPLFVDSMKSDFHLSYSSPCRGTGDNQAPGMLAFDFEGDPRISQNIVDMGGDEFHPHLYHLGNPTPGGQISVQAIGWPGAFPVFLWAGAGILDPPHPSSKGYWRLKSPLFGPLALNPIPASGVVSLHATIPLSMPAPHLVPLQALIGNELSNLEIMQIR